jgi:hypothetical protein
MALSFLELERGDKASPIIVDLVMKCDAAQRLEAGVPLR